MTTDTAPEAAPAPLRQRPIPDQLDYHCEKLAAQIDTQTVPRDAVIAMGAAIVGMGHIATVLRKQAAPLDGAAFADLRKFCDTWLAELAQHGWLYRRLLLADGSELDVGRLNAALNELEQLRAEVQQARVLIPKLLGLAWRNGWGDRAQAQQDVVHQANRQRGEYEKRFVAEAKDWISELNGELAAGIVPQQSARDPFVDLATRTHLNYTPDDEQREQDSAVSGGDGGAWGREPEGGADADGAHDV